MLKLRKEKSVCVLREGVGFRMSSKNDFSSELGGSSVIIGMRQYSVPMLTGGQIWCGVSLEIFSAELGCKV